MHLVLFDAEDLELLQLEINKTYSDFQLIAPGLVSFTGELRPESLAFARQILPDVILLEKESISEFSREVTDFIFRLEDQLSENLSLHIFAAYTNSKSAGARRAEIVSENVIEALKQKRKSIYKITDVKSQPFEEGSALIQLLLVSPSQAYLSYCPPFFCFNHRSLISHVSNGRSEFFPDKLAPSRAFLKLLAAMERFGISIRSNEVVFDLGASPGGWSYVALNKGAKVTAIDRSELDSQLMSNFNLKFIKGNAFTFLPEKTADWMICDVIAYPDKTLELLKNWQTRNLMKKFIVTFKFKGHIDINFIVGLKRYLASVCGHWVLSRLEFNKNEVTAMGVLK